MKELVEILVTASLTILVNSMGYDDWLTLSATVVIIGLGVFSMTVIRGYKEGEFTFKNGFDKPVVFRKRKRR